MNIFSWLKLLWKVKGPIENITQEAKTMNDDKPGYKTTEFWLTLLGTNIPTIIGAIQGVIPPKIAAIILAVANGVYGILRTFAKTA